MEERNWAGLPAELLISITDRLPIPDTARFPAVCTSWLSAVKDFTSCKSSSSSHFPWLALIPVNPNAPRYGQKLGRWATPSPSFRILVSAPSSGELLQIRRRSYWDPDPEEYNIFDVVKFDMEMDGWVDTSDLVGNWSLFLDEKGSMLLSDVPGLEGNYVFFIDSHPVLQDSCVSKVRVYDMGKGTVEPCFRDDTEFNRSIFMHLIWLSPYLS